MKVPYLTEWTSPRPQIPLSPLKLNPRRRLFLDHQESLKISALLASLKACCQEKAKLYPEGDFYVNSYDTKSSKFTHHIQVHMIQHWCGNGVVIECSFYMILIFDWIFFSNFLNRWLHWEKKREFSGIELM